MTLVGLFVALGNLEGSESIVAEQNAYVRVREARESRESVVRSRFERASVTYPPKAIYIRILKLEGELELWAHDKPDSAYTLVHIYPIRWHWMPGVFRQRIWHKDQDIIVL